MIISHKHNYIFFKPKKVGGTSIEVALAKYLCENDTMTPLTKYSKHHDKDQYIHNAQHYAGYYDHAKPSYIRNKIGESMWNNYTKVTAIRNPWDIVVSTYWWKMNKKVTFRDYVDILNVHALRDYLSDLRTLTKPKSFEHFVDNFPHSYLNTDYYLWANGKKTADRYIRFEHLQTDFNKFCRAIKIPPTMLLSLKSKTRKGNAHYSTYYDKETRRKVALMFQREIKAFNYTFEG